MLLRLKDVLTPAELDALRRTAADAPFADGRATAGWAARGVKANEQVEHGPELETMRAAVTRALNRHPLFVPFAQPKAVTRVLISRYRSGMEYGAHVDDALQGGKRADLSFTLFLSNPADYDGGELILSDADGEIEVKLGAGDAVLYSTGALHRVAPVTRGARFVVAGWVRSLVRRADQRDVLFDLDLAARALFEASGKTPAFDRVMKARANLLRMWAED